MSVLQPIKLPANKPVAICTHNDPQSLANATPVVLRFDSNVTLQGVTKTFASPGHTFTVTSSGLYYIEASCQFEPLNITVATLYANIDIYVNGSVPSAACRGADTVLNCIDGSDNYKGNPVVSTCILLNSGDVVTARITQTTGGATPDSGVHSFKLVQLWAYN
jgi:hypothetical protein